MNYTEEQILDKAKKILKDLQGEHFDETNIEKVMFDPKEELLRGHGIKPTWIVIINEPFSNSLLFLLISDETGEPLYIQSKHMVSEITKNKDEKYSYADS